MTFKKIISFPILSTLLLFSAQLWAETDCSVKAISYYLDKGFTPEQVSRMCQVPTQSDTADSTASQATVSVEEQVTEKPSVEASATGESGNDWQGSSKNDDLLFFNKTILSDSLTVTPETLTYIRDECVRYGEEDEYTSFRPKVCGVLKTTINRVGLEVLRAVKGLSIIRDAELLVKGEIRREVINLNSLDSKDRKTFSKILDPTPETFNIETRGDADPGEVAARLPR